MQQHHSSKLGTQNSRSQGSFQSQVDKTKRYKLVNQQQKQNQRQKVHQKVVNQKKKEERKREKYLTNEIGKKRQQLLQLEQEQRLGVLEVMAEAEYNAKLHMQKHNIKKMEKDLQTETFQHTIRERAIQAKKAIEKEKRLINYKEIQAQQLRRTIFMTQQKQRKNVVRTAKSMMVRKGKQQTQQKKRNEKDMKKYLRSLHQHGLDKKLSNSQYNPHILVSKQNQEENQAMKNAEKVKEKILRIGQDNSQQEERMRQKAVMRGQQALDRMKRQRQYENYCQETTQEQVKYNKSRINAGQKNQYCGVKPMTMSQIELNKKLRGQEEFQKTFFKGKKLSTNTQLASKYTIFQAKMKDKKVVKNQQKAKKKQPINYMEEESLINNVSEGHYSFEEERRWEPEAVKEQPQAEIEHIYQQEQRQREYEPHPIMREPGMMPVKNELKQTGIPASFIPEINYDQSQDSVM